MKVKVKETEVMSWDLDTRVESVNNQQGFETTSWNHFSLVSFKIDITLQCTTEIHICQVLLDEDTPNGGLLEEGDAGFFCHCENLDLDPPPFPEFGTP